MTPDDISEVWESAKSGFGAEDFVGLVRAGVSKAWLAQHLYDGFWPGALDIAIQNGKWRQMFRGERAIVLPVCAPDGEIIDLVALRPQTPRSFWRFTDNGRFLGQAAIEDAALLKEPLFVHETPLDWLKAGMAGVVILDWRQFWPFMLDGVPAIRAGDESFGRRLRLSLQRPFKIPEIQVPAQ